MRTDSEKHCSDTSPPHGVDARDGGGELYRQGESRQGAGGHEKEIPARRAAIRKWSIRSCEEEKQAWWQQR